MATEFKLPDLGENVTSGTIAQVLVAVGDTIKRDQPIIEIETDKAVAEIPSPIAGTISKILVKAGDKVKVGTTICVIEEGAAAAPRQEAAPEQAAEKPAPAPERPAPPRLTVLERSEERRTSAPRVAAEAGARKAPALASPSVRRLAREYGVDLNDVPAADPSGRITAQDILAYSSGAAGAGSAAPQPAAAPRPEQDAHATGTDRWGPVVLEPMNAVRKKTVEHMTLCWTTIPHVTHFEKADVTSLDEVRRKHAKSVEVTGGKLTVTCFLLKVIAAALKRFPRFNASIDVANEQLLLKQYYHLGVAADTDRGLLVPVIRDVDQKSVVQLAAELPALAEKARTRKLTLDEMQGATFTITNLGGIGGTGFTPIINAPEVAILGVSRTQIEPVFMNGQFVPRAMLPLSLSYDHRVIDGADAARFMRWVAEALENPWSLVMDRA